MRLTSLAVQNVRTHTQYSLSCEHKVTIITGPNGSGKTSLLEAIYIALQGSSFKSSDADILKFNTPWYRIDAVFDNETRVVKFDLSRTSGKKSFEIRGKTNYRLPFSSKYPVILFDPDELRLIHGSPARRRQFIDRFISQYDQEYSLSLRRYERALKQRNTALKRGETSNIFVWDVALSKYGAYIIERRIELLQKIRPLLAATYKEIAHSDDEVHIGYSEKYTGSIEQRLLSELHQSIERDGRLGYTSIGPHRHDILFTLNTAPAASIASRGETRTIVLALKFLEVDVVRDNTEKDPIILLDDVFSELDETRQKALMERFSSSQTIITSVTAPTTEYTVMELSD